ncbi:MAG: hypothetical protein NHB32_08425 [Fischerella sp. CENA71]|nr:hypothetical protein [Fischerella sp. CENA71]
MSKFISIVVLAASITLLLSFLSRVFPDFALIVLIFKAGVFLVSSSFAIAGTRDRFLFGLISSGMLVGVLLGYQDEIELLWRYQFTEVFVPLFLFVAVAFVVGGGYVYSRQASRKRHHW